MLLSDFDFDLPEDRIAVRPVHPRDSARMLVVGNDGTLTDRSVADLPAFLRAGDALVFNDTRVIAARLRAFRPPRPDAGDQPAGAKIEITLHRRRGPASWTALAKPGKRLREGDTLYLPENAEISDAALACRIVRKSPSGEIELEFDHAGSELDALIDQLGMMPIPPYIASKRAEDAQDREDYQTVYAVRDGSVASPTAGLHFTPALLDELKNRGVSQHFLTLHVGAGTFLPVRTDVVEEHEMHAEFGEISEEVANALNEVRARGGRIVSVGTTSLRLLESAADDTGHIQPFYGETKIFITPGYRFRAVDILMTNFHLPKSTLFMLVCAFSGTEIMKKAYNHAICAGYRFFSYGDSSLLFGRLPR